MFGVTYETTRFLCANLDFNTGVVKDKAQLKHLVQTHYVPGKRRLILCTQETKNLRLKALLHSMLRTLRVRGKQGKGEARSGTAIAAYGARLLRARLWLGGSSRATLARWVTRAGVKMPGGKIIVQCVHVEPPRSGKAPQQEYIARVKERTQAARRNGHGWIALGDWNTDLFAVARELDGQAFGLKGGIGIIVSPNIRVTNSGSDYFGMDHKDTDHPAWWVDVERVL